MRKFLILFLSLFLFACGTGMEEQNNNENENNEQAVEINDSGEELKIETVFSQDMEESVDYSIFSIKLDETEIGRASCRERVENSGGGKVPRGKGETKRRKSKDGKRW